MKKRRQKKAKITRKANIASLREFIERFQDKNNDDRGSNNSHNGGMKSLSIKIKIIHQRLYSRFQCSDIIFKRWNFLIINKSFNTFKTVESFLRNQLREKGFRYIFM